MRAALAPLALLIGLSTLGALGCNSSNETKFTGLEPNTGTFVGGEEIAVLGANFPRGGVVVRFGLKEAKPVVFEADNRMKVLSPPGDRGTNADVTLIFDDGRAFVLKSGFRYVDSTQQRQTMDKFMKKVSGESK